MPHLFQVQKIKNLSMGRRSLRLFPAPRSCYQWTDGTEMTSLGSGRWVTGALQSSPAHRLLHPQSHSQEGALRDGGKHHTSLPLLHPLPHTHATKVRSKETEGAGGGGNHSDDNQKSNYLIQKKIKQNNIRVSYHLAWGWRYAKLW